MGRSPDRGTILLDTASWEMETNDPFISGVVDFVEATIKKYGDDDFNFIQLQAAYLILWTAIERVAALKFYIGKRDGNVEKALEEALSKDVNVNKYFNQLKRIPYNFRPIYRSDEPARSVQFVPNNSLKCIKYLRQIRHNVVHRGKAATVDVSVTLDALEISKELFKEFRKY